MNANVQNMFIPPRKNIPALTGLHGLAAAWVFLFHLLHGEGVPVVEYGYMGVDIFFVLSGFVLSHVYLRQGDLATAGGYLRFVAVRLTRIYPLHVFMLGVMLTAITVFPGFPAWDPTAAAPFGTSAFIAHFFLVQNWAYTWAPTWNTPAWSISAEWFAYLVFPFMLVPIRRITSAWLLICLAGAVLGGTIAILDMAGYRSMDVTVRPGMVRMAGEFTAGCLVYAAFSRGWRFPALPGLALIAGLLGIGMLLPSCRFFTIFAFPLMVTLAAQGRNYYAHILEFRPVLFLGEISYSVYMVHMTVILAFEWLRNHDLQWNTAMIDTTRCLVVLVLSVASYHFVEIPARKWGRRLASADRIRSALATTPVAD